MVLKHRVMQAAINLRAAENLTDVLNSHQLTNLLNIGMHRIIRDRIANTFSVAKHVRNAFCLRRT